MDTNPCDKIKEIKVVDEPPAILTVDALTALLDPADPEMLPMVAISSFAGVRTAELMRLTWAEINLASGVHRDQEVEVQDGWPQIDYHSA